MKALINIKCSLHTLNASLFQSEEGWWEELSGRRTAPGHVSSLLQVIRPQGGSTKLEMTSSISFCCKIVLQVQMYVEDTR